MADDNIKNFDEERRKRLKEDEKKAIEEPTPAERKIESNGIAQRIKAEEQDITLKNMNKKYAFIHSYAGSPAILHRVYNDALDLKEWIFMDASAFHLDLCDQTIPDKNASGKPTLTLISKWWLINQYKRQYDTVTFEPNRAPGEYEIKGEMMTVRDTSKNNEFATKQVQHYEKYLNTYLGFKYEPKEGDWHWFLHHLYVVLSNKDPEYFRYILYWFVWSVQNPGKVPGVALIFKGKKGAGKGVICQAMVDIFGAHGMTIANGEYLTGKHNDHLARCIFMFADEAYYPGDKQVEGVLKNLITEDKISVQPKFRSTYTARNCLHLVMATNNDWVIPATHDERRYFIVEVSDKYSNIGRKAHLKNQYFERLLKSLDEAGKSAILYQLQNLKLPEGWHPQRNFPQTKELRHQMERSLTGVKFAMMSLLDGGVFPGMYKEDKYIISSKRLVEYLMEQEPGVKLSAKAVANIVQQLGAMPNPDRRDKRGWIFPPLQVMRNLWDRDFLKKDWTHPGEEWALATDGERF